GDLDGGAPQHLGVELVGPGLDLARDLQEQGDDFVAVDREAVARRLLLERVGYARLPIDESAVDVEGDEGDIAWEGHEAAHCRPATPMAMARDARGRRASAAGRDPRG